MNKITIEAPAKINLTLDILRKLPSGYHEIESVKQSVQIKDILTIRESENMRIRCNIPEVPLDSKNLVWKAVDLLKSRFGIEKNVEIDIKKNIPVGAGLGGGSSDAAATLNGLNKLWGLCLEEQELIGLASEVGCGCCFCISGGTAVVSGIGNEIKRIKTPELNLVVAYLDFQVSTRDAYSSLDYSQIGKNRKTKRMIAAIEKENVNEIAENLHNDFEFSIFEMHPEIREIKKAMLENGALGSVMSGSGSAVFGIAESRKSAERICSILRQKLNFAIATSTC